MEHDAHETGRQDAKPDRLGSRRRMWLTSGSLVGAGLLAGAILAGTLSANATGGGGGTAAVPAAATASQDSGGATSSSTPDPDRHGLHDWWDDWHGDGGSSVSDATSAKVKDAVLAKYPGASVWWVRQNSGGGYDAYIDTKDGQDLAVHLDGSFAITGTDTIADHGGHGDGVCPDKAGASVPDATAAKVKDAVLAKYPDASIWWVRADPDGGYDAYIDTKDGQDLAVRLDGSFAVTGSSQLPDHGDLDHHGSAVSSDTAAKVTSSVVAHYPGATVPWVWADPDGGYVAYAKTSDGKGVVVHLDGSFAITSTDDVPTC